MTAMSSSGIPADWKVKSRITRTKRTDTTDTMILSVSNWLLRSISEVDSPTI